MATGVVVKIGGSLLDSVEAVLQELKTTPVPVLLIPGGGIFANKIRTKKLNDEDAHWATIQAMNQYGKFLSTYGLKTTEYLTLPKNGLQILLPERIVREHDPLPHSWDVTSDSIALWVAQQLNSRLFLIKSRSGDYKTDSELVDTYFLTLAAEKSVKISVINGRKLGSVADCLSFLTETHFYNTMDPII